MKFSTEYAQRMIPEGELASVPNIYRPQALGAVPRLGLGSRTTILGWPIIFNFLSKTGIFANAIQNSVARELMPLEVLHDPAPRQNTYLPGLGMIEIGHTGSTIEGLLDWGIMAARQAEYSGPGFGADADHLPVHQPGSTSWSQTVRFIQCARRYSHFTLDVGAVTEWKEKPGCRLANVLPAVRDAVTEINMVREAEPFDLEISLDESPEDIASGEAATTPDEMSKFLDGLAQKGIRPTYLAPHLGFTKGSDASDPEKLAKTIEKLCCAASEYNALLSIHSGDYLSRTTRKMLRQASGGRLLFKVSPAIQDVFIDAMLSHDAGISERWVNWTLDYAERHGYPCQCCDKTFRKYAFVAFGARNHEGDFEMRERLYSVSEPVITAFRQNLERYLEELADDLLLIRKINSEA